MQENNDGSLNKAEAGEIEQSQVFARMDHPKTTNFQHVYLGTFKIFFLC